MVWPALVAGASRLVSAVAARPLASFLSGVFASDFLGGIIDAIPFVGGGNNRGGGGPSSDVRLAIVAGLVLSMVVAVGKILDWALE